MPEREEEDDADGAKRGMHGGILAITCPLGTANLSPRVALWRLLDSVNDGKGAPPMSEPHGHAASHEAATLRPMRARDPSEVHRAATPLELLFDLCFVVAIAQAATHLHHGIGHGHFSAAILGYVLVFFAIWWAWMNFTWFASSYDTDDVPYRLKVLVQMAGALVIAAGVPRAFEHQSFGVITLGYVITRVALVAQWLRAARADPARRTTAIRYAVGITVCQIGWILRLAAPEAWVLPTFLGLVVAEVTVPIWAESKTPTTWHAQHIAERYGLLTLIVLGESVLAATLAIQSAMDLSAFTPQLVTVTIGGLLTLFSMWWIYFDRPVHDMLTSSKIAFVWGYGHFVVFGATAAVGAGLAVSIDAATHASHISTFASGAALSVPVAIYVVSVWFLQVRPLRCGPVTTGAFLLTAAVCVASAASSYGVLLVGLAMSALTGVLVVTRRTPHSHA